MDVEAYFKSLNDELHSLKNRVRGIIEDTHWATDGLWRESVVRSMLRRQLPKNILVGTGFLLCPNGQITTQQDIILYSSDAPLFFQDGNTIILESKYAVGIIEVKSRLNATQLGEALQKLSKTLEKAYNSRLLVSLFSYEFDNVREISIKEKLEENTNPNLRKQIDLISLGSQDFLYFWHLSPPVNENQGRRNYQKWHHYHFEQELAVGYFIHNIVEHCIGYQNGQFENTERQWWYPEESKETHLVQVIPLVQPASQNNLIGESHE